MHYLIWTSGIILTCIRKGGLPWSRSKVFHYEKLSDNSELKLELQFECGSWMIGNEKPLNWFSRFWKGVWVNPFQPSITICIETTHLIYNESQVTGFYMNGSTGLKWVK